MKTRKLAGTLPLRGGTLCLDFTNTVTWRATDKPREWLTSYPDLVGWGQRVSVLTDATAALLLAQSKASPEAAEAVLARARRIREAIYRVFFGIATGQKPEPVDLDVVNAARAEALARSRLVPTASAFVVDWPADDGGLDRPLWVVVCSAVELLTSADLRRVSICAGEGCGWLFLDASPNGSRRWCDTRDCGNRARVREHRQRSRAAREDSHRVRDSHRGRCRES